MQSCVKLQTLNLQLFRLDLMMLQMPKYNYRCKACNSKFTVFHKIGENCNECIECKATEIIKVLSNANLLDHNNHAPVGTHLTEMIEENKFLLQEFKKEKLGKL
jgi:putative FmdB family regulatory protein